MSEEKRPEWMSSISGIVNPEDYLLGRKIDKTFELCQQEKAERAKEARINLIANDKLKLVGDPILDLERRREQLKLEILSNPMRLKQLRDQLLKNDKTSSNCNLINTPEDPERPESRKDEPTTSRSRPRRSRSRSPSDRSISLKNRSHLSRDRSRSPRNRSRSPRYRSRSPRYRSRSQRYESRSSGSRSRSPGTRSSHSKKRHSSDKHKKHKHRESARHSHKHKKHGRDR